MALLVVCRFITFALWRAPDLDISTETDEFDDEQRKPQSLEAFTRVVWVKLPAELKHMIFRELVGKLTQAYYNSDHQKLSRLSLSCRAWCQIFRPCLFELLRFESKSSTALAAQFRELYSVMSGSSRWLTEHIHTITVIDYAWLRPPLPVHEPIFSALLGIIRSLRELNLISNAADSLLVDQPLLLSWRQRCRSLQHLRSIRMEHCSFPSFSGLIRFLAALPSLQHVVFDRPTWGSEDSQPPQWRPHICNSGFHQIKSITFNNDPSPFSISIPSWIFATASTHFQHSRRQQSRADPPDVTLTPQSEIMQIAALFEKAYMATVYWPIKNGWRRKWKKVHSDKGTNIKLACNKVHALIDYIVDSYTFRLTPENLDRFLLPRYRQNITFETRPSPVAGNAPLSQTWAVHRVTLSCKKSRRMLMPLRENPMLLSRDTVTSLLSLSTSLQIFEIEYGEGCTAEQRAELLSFVREALVDLPSWLLEVNATLESGEFSKLRIVRQG